MYFASFGKKLQINFEKKEERKLNKTKINILEKTDFNDMDR